MQTLHAASGTCLCRCFVAWSPFAIPLTCTVFTQTACMLSSHSFEKFCTPVRALSWFRYLPGSATQSMLGNHISRELRNRLCPAGSLPLPTAGSTCSGAPSADLGELLEPGAGQGTTAPRMSNATARSLGLVPPKETPTRTLGEQAETCHFGIYYVLHCNAAHTNAPVCDSQYKGLFHPASPRTSHLGMSCLPASCATSVC